MTLIDPANAVGRV